ncbi:MAG: ATP-binding cassette domain-containing protein [Gemmatimonadales bacterium]|nr:ATP-binding cassette domain-containing protein [Gemmatimonadales bacterium]
MLTLTKISKAFGALLALDDVSFDVAAGEVHALLGENGAGKSTLVRIAAGMIPPDAGVVGARPAAPVGFVAQHFSSIPAFTVAENIALAAGWRETARAAEQRAAEVIARLGLPLDATAVVETLSVQLRQRLEIVKALAGDARVLLLDEPSAVLAPREVTELLELVRDFAAKGGAVVLITHKLDEVFAAADRVTVLRRGKVTFSGPVTGETPATLSRAMIGGDLPSVERTTRTRGDVVVRAEGMVLERVPLELAIRAGEIVGVAAVEGNGQRALLRAIAGLNEIVIKGGTLQVTGPVAFVPEDRTTEGIIPTLTLTENVLLGDRAAPWWLDWPALRTRTTALLESFDVRGGDAETPAASLSGGNQQKLIFARVLERAPRVLVVEDPTRGLDVQATAAIHERLRAAAAGGAAVIVHSSDLDEVLELADRLLVMANGRLTELPIDAPRDMVGDAMLGVVPT